MLIFKEQIHYLGHLVSGSSIPQHTDKIEALMKLKPPTSIKEVKDTFSVSLVTTENLYAITQIRHTS